MRLIDAVANSRAFCWTAVLEQTLCDDHPRDKAIERPVLEIRHCKMSARPATRSRTANAPVRIVKEPQVNAATLPNMKDFSAVLPAFEVKVYAVRLTDEDIELACSGGKASETEREIKKYRNKQLGKLLCCKSMTTRLPDHSNETPLRESSGTGEGSTSSGYLSDNVSDSSEAESPEEPTDKPCFVSLSRMSEDVIALAKRNASSAYSCQANVQLQVDKLHKEDTSCCEQKYATPSNTPTKEEVSRPKRKLGRYEEDDDYTPLSKNRPGVEKNLKKPRLDTPMVTMKKSRPGPKSSLLKPSPNKRSGTTHNKNGRPGPKSSLFRPRANVSSPGKDCNMPTKPAHKTPSKATPRKNDYQTRREESPNENCPPTTAQAKAHHKAPSKHEGDGDVVTDDEEEPQQVPIQVKPQLPPYSVWTGEIVMRFCSPDMQESTEVFYSAAQLVYKASEYVDKDYRTKQQQGKVC